MKEMCSLIRLITPANQVGLRSQPAPAAVSLQELPRTSRNFRYHSEVSDGHTEVLQGFSIAVSAAVAIRAFDNSIVNSVLSESCQR